MMSRHSSHCIRRINDSGNESEYYSSSDPDTRVPLVLPSPSPSIDNLRRLRQYSGTSSAARGQQQNCTALVTRQRSRSSISNHHGSNHRSKSTLDTNSSSSGSSSSSSSGNSRAGGRTTSSSSLMSTHVTPRARAKQNSQMQPMGATGRRPKKVKPWIVHVTYGQSDVAFSKNKRLVVLRPFDDNAQKNCEFQAININSKQSVLKSKYFKQVLEMVRPPHSMLPGYFCAQNFPHKPGGFLMKMEAVTARRRERIVADFAQTTGIEVPIDDVDVARSITYSHLVAEFVHIFYFYLMKLYNISEDDDWIRTSLKVVFHGLETAPAFLMLSRMHSFDNMSTAYLIGIPAITNCLPMNQFAAQQEAEKLGVEYWYTVERTAVKDADLLFSVMKGNCSKLTKRHYGRLTDNSRYFAYGKCKSISIKKPKYYRFSS